MSRFKKGFFSILKKGLAMSLMTLIILLLGCQSVPLDRSGASFNLLGGTQAGKKFPEVQMIHIGGNSCSGTFIDSRHFLTAAHCLSNEKGSVSEVSKVTLGDSLEQAMKIDIHPGYGIGPLFDPDYDMAIVTFGEMRDRPFAKISRHRARLGEGVTLVGFGHDPKMILELSRPKRLGVNQIHKFNGTKISIQKSAGRLMADYVVMEPGDSGCGWFDSFDELLAIGTTGSSTESTGVIINVGNIREFISEVIKETENTP